MLSLYIIVLKALNTIEDMRSLTPRPQGERKTMEKGQIDIENISFSYTDGNPVIRGQQARPD